MTQLRQILSEGASAWNINLNEKQLEQFEQYAALLTQWNQKVNLTAIVEPQKIAVKHFIDSLSVMAAQEIPQNATIIDVGTGAGFPGIPLLIARPDIRLTLLDSLNKRLVFLNEVLGEVGLEADIVHARAEEAGQNPLYREQFDFAVSRAVAPMHVLCEYCLPLVKVGGSFIAMKGPQATEETNAAKTAVALLGGKQAFLKQFALPDESTRYLVFIEKRKPSEKIYPRHGSKISKKPL